MRSIRPGLASERGLATPIVIAVMSVVALLAAGAALAALGASVSYVGTPALPANASCADGPAIAADVTSTDHCITATGTVGTVSRRLQARVRVARGGLFSTMGMIGLDHVTIMNSGKVWSNIGSNGLIRGHNSTEIYGTLNVPTTAPSPTINGRHDGVVRTASPWSLAQTDFAPAVASNNNAVLSGWGSSWNSATREAVLDGKKYTLPAGTYLMCELFADNSVDIDLTGASASNPVRIFVDSPDRPGSDCPAGSGRFCLDNSIKFNRPGNAAALEIYVYGTAAVCATGRPNMPFQASSYRTDAPIVLNNSVDLNGTIYAPTTHVRLNNSIKMEGAIGARSVFIENSVDFWHADELQGGGAAAGPIRRMSWVECRSKPTTATDPESGCT